MRGDASDCHAARLIGARHGSFRKRRRADVEAVVNCGGHHAHILDDQQRDRTPEARELSLLVAYAHLRIDVLLHAHT